MESKGAQSDVVSTEAADAADAALVAMNAEIAELPLPDVLEGLLRAAGAAHSAAVHALEPEFGAAGGERYVLERVEAAASAISDALLDVDRPDEWKPSSLLAATARFDTNKRPREDSRK